jgi:hypothetical protein
MSLVIAITALTQKLRQSRQGAVAIHLGLITVALIGFAGLGVEIGFVIYKHRQMQSAADSAALGAATALSKGYPVDFALEADALAAEVGFVKGSKGVAIAVNHPPASGAHSSVPAAVEVIITQPQTLSLVGATQWLAGESDGSGLFTLGVRAVAISGGGGTYCLLQLDSGAAPGFSMSNGARVTLSQCGVAVNAIVGTALLMTGGSRLDLENGQSVSVVGLATINNGAAISPSNALKTSQANVSDPYANVAMPALTTCAYNNKSFGYSNGQQTMSPGVYCNGVFFGNSANVAMSPGVYIIDRGAFSVQGGVTLTGANVTIVLTSSTGDNYATLTIGNGAKVTLSAPTTGATAGMVVFGDRRAPRDNSSDLGGGAKISIDGALYLPSQKLIFQNGADNPSGCTQVIAGTIELKGGSRFGSNCPAGVSAIGGGAIRLVE